MSEPKKTPNVQRPTPNAELKRRCVLAKRFPIFWTHGTYCSSLVTQDFSTKAIDPSCVRFDGEFDGASGMKKTRFGRMHVIITGWWFPETTCCRFQTHN
jgi:hypothetical protein